MDLEQFIDLFSSRVCKNFTWSLVEEGKIRAPYYKSRVCPATALYETTHDLGVCDVMQEVMKASDNKEGHNQELRHSLLELCGLLRA
jgi:hypothetical protein